MVGWNKTLSPEICGVILRNNEICAVIRAGTTSRCVRRPAMWSKLWCNLAAAAAFGYHSLAVAVDSLFSWGGGSTNDSATQYRPW